MGPCYNVNHWFLAELSNIAAVSSADADINSLQLWGLLQSEDVKWQHGMIGELEIYLELFEVIIIFLS